MLEDKLEKILKEKIIVFGCGRTDKGVHASQYFFHIDVNNEPTFDLEFVLRQHLPSTISLFEIIKVKSQQHTRYHAQERKYDYFIHTKPDPFLERYSVLYQEGILDIDSMKSSAKLLQEYTDFRSFCIQPDAHNHTLCDINNSNLFGNKDGTRLHFTISGNRFLKGMIRVLVATLLKSFSFDLLMTSSVLNLSILSLYKNDPNYDYCLSNNNEIHLEYRTVSSQL